MNKKENTRHCDCCGAKINGNDYEEFDGEILCPSCLERETVLCEHCGTRIWNDDNAGDERIALCQSCRDDHYVECENCDRCYNDEDARRSTITATSPPRSTATEWKLSRPIALNFHKNEM
ncbi:MAG: hypothetical protein NC299_04020 [Lachnospiraceae bacterium]|nr:hypothetical protein [Ruminococcus sp.]MCM1274514.1 hypothetical protein [Lachnospiraceae bacterium]